MRILHKSPHKEDANGQVGGSVKGGVGIYHYNPNYAIPDRKVEQARCVKANFTNETADVDGGLYGVALGGAFCGESMFSRAPNASKVALVHLVARLRRGGFRLLDTQFVTDHLKQFGAVEIPAREYLRRLEDALKTKAVFQFDLGVGVLESELDSLFRQSRTQTS